MADNNAKDELLQKEMIASMRFEMLDISFERCQEIPNEANGKFKFLKKEQ